MKKRCLVGFCVLGLLVFAIVLFGCEEEVEYGSLTINNLPTVPSSNSWGYQVYWIGGVYYDDDIKSQNHLIRFATAQENTVASFENPDGTPSHKSPFSLKDVRKWDDKNNRPVGFTDSGTYLVYMMPASMNTPYEYRVYMSINFKNGRATIDFNDMLREGDL